jgi:hypothetical protein
MAKRTQSSKRRDRKSGVSPYSRYQKQEYRYSAGYYQWFAEVTGSRHRLDRGPKSTPLSKAA